MNEKELTIDMLKDAAENLNKLFDPPIKTEDINLLKNDLKEAGVGLLDSDKDELSEETQKVLVGLGVQLPWDSEEVVMKIEQGKEEQREQGEIKNAKKNNDNPIINKSNNNINNKSNNNDNSVDNMANNNDNSDYDRMDKEEHEDNKKENDKKIIKKISRISFYHQAIRDLCKSGATKQEIMQKSDELYRQNGGIAKFKATNIASIALGSLIEFNVLTEDENKKLKLV